LSQRVIADADAKDQRALKSNYKFLAVDRVCRQQFSVASTKYFAHQFANAKSMSRPADDAAHFVNSDVVLHFDALRAILADNRSQLVAPNMLTEGHTKDEAEKKIDELLELVGWFDRLVLSLDTTQSELRFTLDVGLRAPK
jgi:hypothetical protein